METRGVVEVGDTIDNDSGEQQDVTQVEPGKYGTMVHSDGGYCWRYYPSELRPDTSYEGDRWQNWPHRGVNTLPNGMTVAYVSLRRQEPDTLAAHEAHWEKTRTEWQPEPMQSKPLPEAANVMPVSQAQKDIDELWV